MSGGAHDNSQVLVVDDEDGISELVATFFERGGFVVERAAGGWEAFERVKAAPPRLVLTDVRMELGDGIELLEQIQALPASRPLVALMSGYADVTIADVMNRGAVAYLAKPLNFQMLPEFARAALMPRAEAWARTAQGTEAWPLVQRRFASMDQALAAGEIDFGMGGFFLQANDLALRNDTPVRFRLSFEHGDLASLAGEGLLRWTRQSSQHGFPKGIGVEVSQLDAEGRTWLLAHNRSQDPRAFLPIGRRLSR